MDLLDLLLLLLRGDVITLNVEAPTGGGGYNVADVASLKTKQFLQLLL